MPSGADVDWPDVDELKQLLDVTSNDWDDELSDQLDAAIDQVKFDVGSWDELVDVPDVSLARAAMRLAVLARSNAEQSLGLLSKDPTYQRLLKGHRRRFGIA